MVTWALTFAAKVSGRELLTVSVQVAVVPLPPMVGFAQVFDVVLGVGVTAGVMVPKVTGDALPGRAVTTMVKTWAWLTGLTALTPMLTAASTYLLTAGPL